ncbi:MAG TPA: MFS transporter, partial [Longimicrobium sp.]|nr:MFS transporter [Longimicrobium sp.]
LILLFTVLPSIVISPIAGALVDRWDRRVVMLLADTGAALSTLAMAGLLMVDWLEVWHVCVAVTVAATLRTFQWPAWSATTSLLVPEEHLGRASGMMNFARSASQVVGPLLAGVLVGIIGLEGVIVIDFITFGVAVLTLAVVRFPATPRTAEGAAGKGSLLREAAYGWQYIWKNVALRWHLGYFAIFNLGLAFTWVLFPPLVLSFSTPAALGTVGASVGLGAVIGSVVMTAWGGPRGKVRGILASGALLGTCLIVMGLRPSVPLVALAVFGITFGIPIINGCFMRLWQPRIAPDVQGRAFAAIQVIVWSIEPVAYLAAGPLADRVFRPLLVSGGPLASSLGPVFGVGPGRGIGLMLAAVGTFVLAGTALASLLPAFRRAEQAVPVTLKPPVETGAPVPA